MTVDQIRYLLGGYGKRLYSDEICRTELGIAWYDGNFRIFATDEFFNWKKMSLDEGTRLIDELQAK